MLIFGFFGYLMRKFGFEGAPFLLALVLGPMLEVNLDGHCFMVIRSSFSNAPSLRCS